MQLLEQNRRNSGSDRFIPKRVNFEKSRFHKEQENQSVVNHNQPLGEIFSQNKKRILFFNDNKLPKHEQQTVKKNKSVKKVQQIKPNWNSSQIIQNGEKQIMNIPGFKNDYYLNLIDAADKRLLVSILHDNVILFNKKQNQAAVLVENDERTAPWADIPTSVKFNPHQKQKVAIGYNGGKFQILDWKKNLLEQEQSPHSLRIGCFDWNPKMDNLIASGSKDKSIKLYDCRVNKKVFLDTNFHYGEICGLNWNQNGYQLASGGNDNLINIWDIRNSKKPQSIIQEHNAAVRALKWCPWQSNYLASGGGSGDMRLVIHDTNKQKIVKNILTMSQVCAVVWDEEARTLLTAHGFSKYQMCMWDFESEKLLYEFMGHKNRILSLLKPDNSNIVFSASSDNTLRVWNLNQYIKPLVKKNTILYPAQLR